jgi:single-strand DNA-binding protein
VPVRAPPRKLSEVILSRSLNKVTLIGNLGADPEVRSTSSGARVATLSLATSRQWTSAAGERQEKTEWHRVVLWNNKGSGLADLAEKYMKKGDKLFVEGRIEYRQWEDREGKTRYTTEIIGREVIMLSPRSGGVEGVDSVRAPAGGGNESYEDFPEALDEEDDDLPF